MVTISSTVKLFVTTCNTCGIAFGMPDDFDDNLRKNGQTFYCPNGHSLWYGKSEADKLREELASKTKTIRAWATDYNNLYENKKVVDRKLASTKGVVTRLKNRIEKGMCPCCRRNFVQLADHMKHQHPEWQPLPDESEAPK